MFHAGCDFVADIFVRRWNLAVKEWLTQHQTSGHDNWKFPKTHHEQG